MYGIYAIPTPMELDEERYTKNPAETVQKWSDFLRKIRHYFYAQHYNEVTTASLVQAGAFESAIDTIKASTQHQTWELHTSPEMEMKRLLSLSASNIFQIAKCFRDDPDTSIHGKEFTMLEYYKVGATYREIIEETKALFQSLTNKTLNFQEQTIEETFQKMIGISLSQQKTKEQLANTLKQKGILSADPSDSWEDLFFKLMVEKIEPSLDKNTLYILKDYPTSTSVLSKAIPGTGYSERFEIYWQGMEICNGCTENTSLEALKQNFEKESKKRIKEGKSPHPTPEKFLSAMASFPACSGVAIGLDRLFCCIP